MLHISDRPPPAVIVVLYLLTAGVCVVRSSTSVKLKGGGKQGIIERDLGVG